MTQLHRDSTEANKHTPKGFNNGATPSAAVKSEQGTSVYDQRNVLTQVISFSDGALPPPTTALGAAFVIIDTGGGAIDAGWSGASYGEWVRSDGAIFWAISPPFGALCNDQNGDWFKYNGISWDAFGAGGTDTNLGNTNLTLTAPRVVTMGANTLSFEGNTTTFKGIGSTDATTALSVKNSSNQQTLKADDSGNLTIGIQYEDLRVNGYFTSNGPRILHLLSNCHTFRADNNNSNRSVAVFTQLNGTVVLSVGTGGIGINTDASGTASPFSCKMRSQGSGFSFQDQSGGTLLYHSNVNQGDRFGFGRFSGSGSSPTDGIVNIIGSKTYGASIKLDSGVDPIGTNLSSGSIWHTANKIKVQAGVDTVQLYAQNNLVGFAPFVVGVAGVAVTDQSTFGGFTLQQWAQLFLNNGLAK